MRGINQMSWFKIAKNFDKRNTINAKMRYLQGMKEKLEYLGKFVFQSGKNAKNINYRIIASDKITSYPALHETLIEADHKALDSPWKFADLCGEAVFQIDQLLYKLKRERDELEERLNLEDFKQNLIKCVVPEIQAEMYKKQFQDFTNKVYHTINIRSYKL